MTFLSLVWSLKQLFVSKKHRKAEPLVDAAFPLCSEAVASGRTDEEIYSTDIEKIVKFNFEHNM